MLFCDGHNISLHWTRASCSFIITSQKSKGNFHSVFLTRPHCHPTFFIINTNARTLLCTLLLVGSSSSYSGFEQPLHFPFCEVCFQGGQSVNILWATGTKIFRSLLEHHNCQSYLKMKMIDLEHKFPVITQWPPEKNVLLIYIKVLYFIT